MSKIRDILIKLGTDGVNIFKLEEICDFNRGTSITKKDISPGDIPVIAGGQTPAYYCNQSNRDYETITVSSSGAYAGYVAYWNKPIFVSDAFSVEPDDRLNIKYLYYFLKSKQNDIYAKKKGGGVPHIHGSDLAKFEIPIPPLPVQKEIVRILDQYTVAEEELEAKLQAELDARTLQLEYFRKELFNYSKERRNINVRWITLGDIGRVSMCKRIFKEQTQSDGDVPFYKIGTFGKEPDAFISQELFDEYKEKYSYPKKGEVLLSAAGTIGRAVIFDGTPSYFQDSNIVWLANDEKFVLNKYLYCFYSVAKWAVSKGGTISRLYNDNVRKTSIPIPPFAEQERIISILDRLDRQFNELKQALQSELEARRKQYDYYRDKLLTFKELQV